MQVLQNTNLSSSSYIHHVSLTKYTTAGKTLLQPDGCWDIAVMKQRDSVQILRTGLTTQAVVLEYEEGDEILAISFKPSVFMPSMSAEHLRDQGIPLPKVGERTFWLDAEALEIPSPENVEVFIGRLIKKGLIQTNGAVDCLLQGRPKAMSERTMQRHFLQTTGLTHKYFMQIQRAQRAVSLLQDGRSAPEVAFDLGYTDQPHMINSLKHIMGQTPREISHSDTNLLPWRLSVFYKLLLPYSD